MGHRRSGRWPGLCLSLALAPVYASAASQHKPNVIVIVADDLGHADLGFTGAKDIPTPHLDALARAGVVFENGYVTHPFCSPTRAALLTGRYQQRYGHEYNPPYDTHNPVLGLATDETTLPQLMKDAGYTTAAIGKWHLGATPAHH